MNKSIRAVSGKFRPCEDELDPNKDSLATARARERAETILAHLIDDVKKEECIDLPVVLSLYDFKDGTVQIGCERRRFIRNEHTRWVYVIDTSVNWINGSSDGEIRATFAHEIGHAVLGHCEKEEAEDLFHQEREKSRTEVWLNATVATLSGTLAFFMAAPPALSRIAWICLILHLCALMVQLIPLLCKEMPALKKSRADEYAADAFMARFANPKDLMSDLGKGRNSAYWHMMELALLPSSTHPPLRHRARALGVVVPPLSVCKQFQREATCT